MAENTGLKVHMIMNVEKTAKKFGKKTNKPLGTIYIFLLLRFFNLCSSYCCFFLDILVTTPNRLVYLLKQDPPALDLSKTEWLIVDEADKLFESGEGGFREQVYHQYFAVYQL